MAETPMHRPLVAFLPVALSLVAIAASGGCGRLMTAFDRPADDGTPAASAVAQTSGTTGRGAPVFIDGGSVDQSDRPAFSNVVTVGLFGETAPGEAPTTTQQGEGNLKQISFAPEGGDFTPDVDRTGTFLVYASKQHSESFDLYRKAVDGRTITQITSDPSEDMMPAISPDGRRIAFVSNRNGNWDVFTMSADGGRPAQITFETDDEVQPTWSPDGKQLAFSRKNARTGRWEIWTADADRPSGSTFLCEGFLPRWSPDASRNQLLFQRARQQGSRFYSVWTVDLVQGQAVNPTEIVSAQNAAVIQPNWSPDGSKIVFTTVVDPTSQGSDLPEQSDLWVVDVDGSNRTSLTKGAFRNMQPVWAADGRIYFVSNRGGVENLWSIPTMLEMPEELDAGTMVTVPTDDETEATEEAPEQ
jgi:TolB protein